jgi:hypothetical protein
MNYTPGSEPNSVSTFHASGVRSLFNYCYGRQFRYYYGKPFRIVSKLARLQVRVDLRGIPFFAPAVAFLQHYFGASGNSRRVAKKKL